MKIFVVIPHKFAGCGFYRQYQPHNHLAKNGIDVLLGAGLYDDDGKFCVDADIIQFHKGYFDMDGIREAKRRGIVVIGDIDDWWRLDTEHIFYRHYLNDGTTDKLIEFIRECDYITCTTDLLANEASKINKNVIVLPNAMDMMYDGCKVERVNEDKTVFGYVGGHCHKKDMEMLMGVNNRVGRGWFRLFGFDGSKVYVHYYNILSDNGKLKNVDWVQKADIWSYPQFYNLMDVSLVPLVNNKFNSLKSPLKLVEAGFFKKAVIVSNVEPYSGLLKHKKNCYVVNKPQDWVKGCKWYIDNPSAIEDMGNGLRETVSAFSIEEVNKKRLNFYTDVLKKRNINGSNRHSGLPGINKQQLVIASRLS